MYEPREVLVRFHEIGLKGRNRPAFVAQLVDNLGRATAGLGVEEVRAARMLVRMRLAPDADWDAVRERAARVFGVVKLSRAERVDPTYEAVAACVGRLADAHAFPTFRISANRADKTFPLTSHELNVRLGDLVRRTSGAAVDLSRPALDVRVEVQRADAFVYAEAHPGPGGLPGGDRKSVV